MIKPEAVPQEAVNGLRKAMFKNGTAREYISAAINAWPGMVRNYSWDGSHGRIVLPLTQEPTDG